jgi:hypothetical protein
VLTFGLQGIQRVIIIGRTAQVMTDRPQVMTDRPQVMTDRPQVMTDTLNKLNNEASKYGLIINERKTIYMKCTRKQVTENKLETDTMSYDSVQ